MKILFVGAYDDLDIVREIFLVEVIQDWIKKNLKIDYVIFKEGNYIDIGTADDLVKVINESRL
jgi:dTDP-glucose pyrophosphorylase